LDANSQALVAYTAADYVKKLRGGYSANMESSGCLRMKMNNCNLVPRLLPNLFLYVVQKAGGVRLG